MPTVSTFGYHLIRQAVLADVPTLSALEWACQSNPWPLERVEAFIAEPHEGHEQFGLVALLRGRPVGYAILAMGGGNMSIERIGVVPDQRRQRVGTKLIAMALLEGRRRDLEFVVVVLRETNVAAQRFFHECGFRAGRIAGPLVGWFRTEDGVAMRRTVVLPIPDTLSP
jgi:[ribosomal protein S18]-alanine N-acetyltransferase